MAAHWQGVAREAGYEPKKFKDAKEGEGFSAIVGNKHFKGAVIGDGTQCSGARCLLDIPEVEWCYIGATTAWVVFADGRHRRFLINGLAQRQDQAMNVAGEQIILRPPSKTQTLLAQRRRLRPGSGGTTARAKRNGSKSRGRSVAAQLRNSA